MVFSFPRSAWRYAAQILILCAIAAIVASLFIFHFEEQILDSDFESTIRQLSIGVWSLTMGFMFLSGALGLWAIRSAAANEGRRRIGRFVDAMDYLSDGLFVLDKAGAIIGSNPAVKSFLQCADNKEKQPSDFHSAFPGLSDDDLVVLLTSSQPQEVNADCVYPNGLRTLRFRSQPAEGVVIVLVSDVTEARAKEIRVKQTAGLQLVGRIAGGVAGDFSNILCAIAAHSALLKRPGLELEVINDSLDIIIKETQRGAFLSRLLVDLSRSGGAGAPSDDLTANIREAVSLLRVTLAPTWMVKADVEGEFPVVPFSSAQIEQIVLNLGLLAADECRQPGTLMISLSPPGNEHLIAVGNRFAAVILVSAGLPSDVSSREIQSSMEQSAPVSDAPGLIISVVSSMVEEVGGRMDHLFVPNGLSVYRVCLPHLDASSERDEVFNLPQSELNVYVSRWHVLVGDSSNVTNGLVDGLRRLGTIVDKRNNIAAVLAGLESDSAFDVVVLDKDILGVEARGLLPALAKLAPRVGIVVLCDNPEHEDPAACAIAVFESRSANYRNIIRAMVEAKTRARTI